MYVKMLHISYQQSAEQSQIAVSKMNDGKREAWSYPICNVWSFFIRNVTIDY